MVNFENANKLYAFLNQATLKKKVVPFSYMGKEYTYSLVSDLELPAFDAKTLTRFNRNLLSLLRTFKLFFNPNINSIEIQCVSTFFSSLHLLINYVDNGKVKTIDYSANLIMDKDDYYNLFQVKILNTFTKSDAYKINSLLKRDNFNPENFLLLTSEEIDEYIRKDPTLRCLWKKYDSNGVNVNNYFFYDDFLFALKEDVDICNEKIHHEIETFTSSNRKSCRHIYYLEEPGKYIYINGKKRYIFSLISDQLPHEGLKTILLSYEDRYGLCHNNSFLLASILTSMGIESIFLVAGKRKTNSVEYLYHSWLEIGDLVYDFNGNLIMRVEDYYELYQAKVLDKTPFSEITQVSKMCNEFGAFKNNVFFVNFFCDELSRDLKKNKFLFKH